MLRVRRVDLLGGSADYAGRYWKSVLLWRLYTVLQHVARAVGVLPARNAFRAPSPDAETEAAAAAADSTSVRLKLQAESCTFDCGPFARCFFGICVAHTASHTYAPPPPPPPSKTDAFETGTDTDVRTVTGAAGPYSPHDVDYDGASAESADVFALLAEDFRNAAASHVLPVGRALIASLAFSVPQCSFFCR